MTTQLVNTRLASQIQRRTEAHAYTDTAFYIPAPDLSSLDDHGQPTASTVRVPISCSFTDKPHRETWREMDIEQVDAEIRFAGMQPEKGGKFILSELFGAFVPQKTYEVIGIQQRGAFGYVCALKAVSL